MLRKNLGRQDAETEVFLDKIIEKKGGCNDNVLLIILGLSEINDDEEKVYQLKKSINSLKFIFVINVNFAFNLFERQMDMKIYKLSKLFV